MLCASSDYTGSATMHRLVEDPMLNKRRFSPDFLPLHRLQLNLVKLILHII